MTVGMSISTAGGNAHVTHELDERVTKAFPDGDKCLQDAAREAGNPFKASVSVVLDAYGATEDEAREKLKLRYVEHDRANRLVFRDAGLMNAVLVADSKRDYGA